MIDQTDVDRIADAVVKRLMTPQTLPGPLRAVQREPRLWHIILFAIILCGITFGGLMAWKGFIIWVGGL